MAVVNPRTTGSETRESAVRDPDKAYEWSDNIFYVLNKTKEDLYETTDIFQKEAQKRLSVIALAEGIADEFSNSSVTLLGDALLAYIDEVIAKHGLLEIDDPYVHDVMGMVAMRKTEILKTEAEINKLNSQISDLEDALDKLRDSRSLFNFGCGGGIGSWCLEGGVDAVKAAIKGLKAAKAGLESSQQSQIMSLGSDLKAFAQTEKTRLQAEITQASNDQKSITNKAIKSN